MNLDTFLTLPTPEVADLVRQEGPRVCGFPINGTRRWFMLEHPHLAASGVGEEYLRIAGRRHIELYKLCFDHGIHTLLTPIIGPDILDRDQRYRDLMRLGLVWFAQNPDFLDFYEEYDVRVSVYGDAEGELAGTPFAGALAAYDRLRKRTAPHSRHRLFFGVCGHDATAKVARIAIQFQKEHGRPPTKREIVVRYYGEYVEPVDLFIGSDRPALYDMPLVTTGTEDLYFTVNPSPYLDTHTLRSILYDHMVARRVSDAGYEDLSAEDWEAMDRLYQSNRHGVLGLGRQHPSGAYWYPVPQVHLPSSGEASEVD
jgi:tuberculosinol/isotuberculosinol synthase